MNVHDEFDPMGKGPAFPLANRLSRAVWQVAWLVLARWTPPPLFGWRRFVLRLFGAQIGNGARIYSSVRIWQPANLAVGDRAIVGPGTHLYNQGKITIGERAVISQRAHVCASSHDPGDPHFALVLRPVSIGKGCWIAAEAFVGPGVTVGDGAVLSARGALFGDARPMRIYRGNPAQEIGERSLRRP